MNRLPSWVVAVRFVVVVALFVFGMAALAQWFVDAVNGANQREMQQRDCARVLECLDLGAERDECEALFPKCGQVQP